MAAADCDRTAIKIQPVTENITVNFGATSGVQATGTLTFGAQPTDGETVVVNGVTWTARSAPSVPSSEWLIGATKEATAANLAAALNLSANAAINIATYSVSAAIVTVLFSMGGVNGNAYTLANSSGGHITRSAATLTGGLNTGNGFLLAAGTAYPFLATENPDIKGAIYAVSPTTAAKTAYDSGTWSTGR